MISRTIYDSFMTKDGTFDAARLVEAILLYDVVVISNAKLLPRLALSVGVNELCQALSTGRIVVECGGATALATCDYQKPGLFTNEPLRAPLRFAFETIYVDPNIERNLSVEDNLMRTLGQDKTANLSKLDRRKIHQAALCHHRIIDGAKLRPATQFKSDLNNMRQFVAGALLEGIASDLNVPVHALKVHLEVEQISSHTFHISTDLGHHIKKTNDQLHEVLKARFFQIPSTILQIQRMEAVQAIAGLNPDQARITARRVDLLSKIFLETDGRADLTRVLELSKMPRLKIDAKFDLLRVIALSETEEAVRFRDWLYSKSRNLSDEEVRELTTSWKKRLGEVLAIEKNARLRWLVSNGIGAALDSFVPFGGLGLSALDQFLVNKIPTMGPIGFIENDYREYINSQSD